MEQEEVKTEVETEKVETEVKEEKTEPKVEEQPTPKNDSDNGAEKTEAKKQSRDQDSYYAKLRRERDALKAENEKFKENERKSISKEALENLGLEKEELNDPENLKLAKLYVEATTKGEENPTAYAYKQFRILAKEAKEQEARELENQEAQKAEMKRVTDEAFSNFTKAYGNEAFKDLTNKESLFMKKYGDVVTPTNLVKLYGIYKDDYSKALEKAKDNGAIKTANGDSTDVGKEEKKIKYASDFKEFN